MKKRLMMLGLAAGLSLTPGAFAGQACEAGKPCSKMAVSLLEDTISSQYANLGFRKGSFEVRPLKEMPGLYEVRLKNGPVYFTDGTARYFIMGMLLDPVNRVNLTAARINGEKLAQLKEAIKSGELPVTGDKHSKVEVVIFDDPDCPFCARLESQLTKKSGIKAYHVLSPLVQLHPDARKHGTKILCQPRYRRGEALQYVMKLHSQNIAVPDPKPYCLKKTKKTWEVHDSLVGLYGIDSTPTLVRLTDGQVWNGYLPLSLLKRWASGENLNPQEVQAAMQAGM